MTGERWQEIKNVLEAVLQMNSDQRRAYLDQACSSDQSLRRNVFRSASESRNNCKFTVDRTGHDGVCGLSTGDFERP
jgi:hypothetical protein